jgi:GNAT superfamily N-acetyltransferase
MVAVKVECLPPGSPFVVITAEEQLDRWKAEKDRFDATWPEYNNHGDDSYPLWRDLSLRHGSLQFLLVDKEQDVAVARGRTTPFRWDGTLDDLPAGMDGMALRIGDEHETPTTLSALAAEVLPEHRGRGLSALVIQVMAELAKNAGLSSLVAPVRPNWKDRYPLIHIEHYARWQTSDGLPFDPWMRVHSRLGAIILRHEERSLAIRGTVSEWESWTAMSFPEDGTYTFPFGLAPLCVKDGMGSYFEPNVWMQHTL